MQASSSQKAKPRARGRPRGQNGKLQTLDPSGQSIREQQSQRAKISSTRLATSSKGRITAVHRDATSVPVPHNQPDPPDPPPAEPEVVNQNIEEPPKRPSIYRRAVDYLRDWLPFRSSYLDELLRRDGPGQPASSQAYACASCHVPCDNDGSLYRCMDCDGAAMVCAKCIVEDHRTRSLHAIERWNTKFFERTSLQTIGLTISLGHNGEVCPNAGRRKTKFVVGHTNGYHEVDLVFCGCGSGEDGVVSEWAQLMRHGWFPASRQRISTAFTYRALDFFHELTLQGKTSLYDYNRTLCRITDNSSTRTSWDRYKQLTIVVREWRNLMLLKRSGRGHDPQGIENTKEGECAVECPACPHPGRNLPVDWANAPSHVAWLYVLYLMLDANFRLKLKDRGFKDVELTSGWAYFVEDSKYREFIERMGEQQETNTCSAEHKAIRNANVPHNGYLVSGTAACLCNRHALVRPNGLADLQKGEKYCTMDYVLLSTLTGTAVSIFLTYDIACQYSKNFAKRVAAFPAHMRLDAKRLASFRWAIPKKHWRVHGELGHSIFSLNYLLYAARTFGEGIETGWAHMNPVSMSTKEMAPAGRREVVDDHWNSWNWQKILGFGILFLRRIHEAFEMKEKQEAIFEEYNLTFKPEQVAKWKTAIEQWECNPSDGPDPFIERTVSATLADIKLKLAEEDAASVASGIPSLHEVTASSFLQIGLELEHTQRSLQFRKAKKQSIADRASLQVKRNALMTRIDSWRQIQEIYMPGVHPLLVSWTASVSNINSTADDDAGVDGDAASDDSGANGSHDVARPNTEDIPLFLPSALPAQLRGDIGMRSLLRKEARLRLAIADDCLAEIRRLRRVMAGIAQFKQLNVSGTGQKPNTRIRNLYTKFNDKVAVTAARYRAAYATLPTLDPDGQWSSRLKPLADKDLRGPGNDDEDRPLGEGRREPSWIWLVPRLTAAGDNDGDDMECMQAEWSKTRARARRWAEELELLQEEMRRVLAFFDWNASRWRALATARGENLPASLGIGIRAYAEKQAHMYEALALKFQNLWVPFFLVRKLQAQWRWVNERAGLPHEASSDLIDAHIAPRVQSTRLPADGDPDDARSASSMDDSDN